MKERLNLNERIIVQMSLSALAKTYKENIDECQTNTELNPKSSEFWMKSQKIWQDRYDEVMNLHTKIVEGKLLD